jgi:hypothetical protein
MSLLLWSLHIFFLAAGCAIPWSPDIFHFELKLIIWLLVSTHFEFLKDRMYILFIFILPLTSKVPGTPKVPNNCWSKESLLVGSEHLSMWRDDMIVEHSFFCVCLCVFLFAFFFFTIKIFIKIYSYTWGRFRVTIPIGLMLLITYISPIISPSVRSPSTQSNCKRFFSSVSYRYMKSINHILSP